MFYVEILLSGTQLQIFNPEPWPGTEETEWQKLEQVSDKFPYLETGTNIAKQEELFYREYKVR